MRGFSQAVACPNYTHSPPPAQMQQQTLGGFKRQNHGDPLSSFAGSSLIEPMSLATPLFLLLLLATASPAAAQEPPTPPHTPSPHQLALDAAAQEVQDLEPQHSFLRYRSRVVNSKGDLTRDVIESRDGTVARLISIGGRALTPAEDQAEHERLEAMLESPTSFAKHVRSEQSSKKQAIEIIRLIPDAMIFTYAEGQPQPPAPLAPPADARPYLALDFHPNPAWSPPSLPSETLTGLRGRMWLDPRTHHVAELDVNVFRPVNVGFGVLAKVFPGGSVVLGQGNPVKDRWPIYQMAERVTLRALMVKTYKENADIHNSDFTPVPGMSYQQAVQLLLATPLPR